MKYFFFSCLVLTRLLAQNAGSVVIGGGSQTFNTETGQDEDDEIYFVSGNELYYQITVAPNGVKTFTFIVEHCVYREAAYVAGLASLVLPPTPDKVCTPVAESVAETYGPVQEAIGDFLSDDSDAPHRIVYANPYSTSSSGKLRRPEPSADLHPDLMTVQPVTPTDPTMVMLDGFTQNIVQFDLTTFAVISSVTLPPQAMVFATQPTTTGPENIVWTAHGGTVNEISVCNLATQTVLATIPTPSLNPNNTLPVKIAFTNDGGTVLYVVSYYTPDSSGNNGTLLIFDAVSQTLTSTLPLKFAPTALVMAPDSLTAYLIGSNGTITYYDVLSGTADLTAPLPEYAGSSVPIFIHPDGTRLLWNTNYVLNVFDLTTRKITAQYNSGLPSTSASSMRLSQDGSQAFFSSGTGSNVILDTLYGNILATFNTTGGSLGFGGEPSN